MFDQLTHKLNQTFRNWMGQGRFTDENIKEALTDVKKALLEADVEYGVVKHFLNQVREEVRGQAVTRSLTPAQALIQVVHRTLIRLMGDSASELSMNATPPVVILLAGLQGSGKTTSAGKLALWIQTFLKKSVMMVSCDVYRPAAIEQLRTVAEGVGAAYFPSDERQKPLEIASAALKEAKRCVKDVLIIDTAGRLHIDQAMMAEVKALHAAVNPLETLFVVDGMTGQDAAKTAKAFNEALPLSGVIVTKLDGDARGGAILSIREVTGKPIKFIGLGEKMDALERFYPDRMASRILGMGDVLSLVEELERKVDKAAAEKLAQKLERGNDFNLEDFRMQLVQMQQMGGLGSIMNKLPGMGNMSRMVEAKGGEQLFMRTRVIIDSMTRRERFYPDILNGSRKRRIALGAGVTIQEVNRLLKQFEDMKKMMKKFSKPGAMMGLMQKMKGLLPGEGGF